MIYIRTFAYNAEDTIEKTIESVLSQTKKEFRYYLMDNGSTDRTGEIIREFAERDNRIVPFYNRVNHAYDENPEFWELTSNLLDEDYYVVLDADDYYEPTFLEEILDFMAAEKLEVAACGSEFFDSETGEVLGQRVLSGALVCRDSVSYDRFFPYIHWNLRQLWGKVYSGKVAKGMWKGKRMGYGGDTYTVLSCLKYAESIGVYGKVLHHYRMSKKSVSHVWGEGRERNDLILHQKTCSYLLSKAGYLSETNMKYLNTVYLNAIKDSLEVLAKARLDASEKWKVLDAIFSEQITSLALNMDLKDFLNGEFLQDVIKKYKCEFLKWTLSIVQEITMEDMPVIERFLNTFNPVFDSFFSTEQLCDVLHSSPDVIADLVDKDYGDALEKVKLLLREGTNSKRYLIQLAQNLAAILSKEEEYVMYSKMYIHNLIICEELEMARTELDEWLQLLPNDEELLKLKDLV